MSLVMRKVSPLACIAAIVWVFGVAGVSYGTERPSATRSVDVEEALDRLSATLGEDEVIEQVEEYLQSRRPASDRGNVAAPSSVPASELPLPAHPGLEEVAVLKSGTAQGAIRVDGYKVLTAGPAPLVIPAAAFTSDGTLPDSFFKSFPGGYVTGDGSNYGCLLAPAYLPDGVTVTEMYATVFDDDAVRNIYVELRRLDNFTGDTMVMATASTTGQIDMIQIPSDSTIASPDVTYPGFSYYLTACVTSADIRLYSVRIHFE